MTAVDLTSNNSLLSLSPEALAKVLREQGIKRFYVMTDPNTGKIRVSHPQLKELAEALSADQRDFDQHEGIFCEVSTATDMIHGAFIHRTCRGQAQGGTRFWTYLTFRDFLNDGIRLSRGMTHKNALAGLWWGGGKGVMSRPQNLDLQDLDLRRKIFEEYGGFISSLKGCYITAEDVGTKTEDMAAIFSHNRFITCIPRKMGGSGNPSAMTALGVVRGMEAALDFQAGRDRRDQEPNFKQSPLQGKHVVVQGAGHVGEVIIDLVLKSGARVTATDINAHRLDKLRDQWHGQAVELVCTAPNDMSPLAIDCDILCPAATGGALNPETIPTIKASIVCGAANNQLEDPQRDGQTLNERGILYLPDFLVNRMGIVNCANEQYGYVEQDPILNQHLSFSWEYSVYQTAQRVLTRASSGESPHQSAVSLAEDLSQELHPIWGHRGQAIIASLTKERSDLESDTWTQTE
ncbi:MAG: hypothetical protein CMH49_00740 [Myxococcales bacterium]|nr:hypothetical protein [Myxococcales bacterium]